jgi:hypothetical protein
MFDAKASGMARLIGEALRCTNSAFLIALLFFRSAPLTTGRLHLCRLAGFHIPPPVSGGFPRNEDAGPDVHQTRAFAGPDQIVESASANSVRFAERLDGVGIGPWCADDVAGSRFEHWIARQLIRWSAGLLSSRRPVSPLKRTVF